MKFSSETINGLLRSLKNEWDVHGFTCTQSVTSSGIVPVWVSWNWLYGEDGYGNVTQCEDAPPLSCQPVDDICAA